MLKSLMIWRSSLRGNVAAANPATDQGGPSAGSHNNLDPAQKNATLDVPASLASDADALFDHKFYADRYAVDPSGQLDRTELFEHWRNFGRFQGLDPHPLFSVEYYASSQDPKELQSTDHIVHFLKRRRSLHVSPHPLFDAKWYLATYSDVKSAGVNPLVHYLKFGHKEGRRPSPTFDGNWYLRYYADVREAGMNPLVHYVMFGKSEGRFRSESDMEAVSRTARRPRSTDGGYFLPNVDTRSLHPIDMIEPGPSLGVVVATLNDVKLLSLDVWDTILYRRCHPDEIKIATARFLLIEYRVRLKIAYRDVVSLFRARRLAEDKSSMTDDFEYRFEDAALCWLEMVFESGTPKSLLLEVSQQLLRHEFAAEVRASYPNASMVDLLERARHLQVVLVSDFYMPARFMLQLLERKGLDGKFVKLYCSSDYAENKRSGRLFQRVANDFGLAPAEILHIGDNKNADVEAAEKQGLRARHYTSPLHEARRARDNRMLASRLAADASPLNYALIEHLRQRAEMKYGATAQAKPLQRLGHGIAPLAIGFILHVIERARLYGVKNVFFFTREGEFLKRLYDRVVADDPYGCSYPRAILLEVSRLATFAPSIDSWTEAELMRMWSLYSSQSPSAFARSLNLDRVSAERYFLRAGIEFETPIKYPWKNGDFMGVINSEEFANFATQSISQQRLLLRDYLLQHEFDLREKINVVVDIGWRGSIQDNLARLCTGHLHGCYLGLFNFLNPQPLNTSKSAWLFDFNVATPQEKSIEVAPIEMLFNSLGGSVAGYSKDPGGEVQASRSGSEGEDRVFRETTRWIQDGILDAAGECGDFVSIHGMTSDDMLHSGWHAFESILKRPTPEFASGFFRLLHNESFGTGEFYSSDVISDLCSTIGSCKGSLLHSALCSKLAGIRWNHALAAVPAVSDAIASIGDEAVHLPSALLAPPAPRGKLHRGARIGFIVPAPIIGSGGHRTIFTIAKQFVAANYEVSFYLENEGDGLHVAQDMMGGSDSYFFVGWDKAAELDVAFATIAHSASFVAEMPNVKMKCYLVQDYEALFNPIGDYYTIAENSYTFALKHFTIGRWLTHVLAEQHAASATPTGLGVDVQTYYVRKQSKRERAICFLYQPEKPRRNGMLGIEAIRLVKARIPDVKVYIYGSNAELDLDFEAEKLGLIRDLSVLNELYNRCAVGLCISMSNPSRIPFEMMACGMVPVDVYRYNNMFDYKEGTALLAYQSAKSVAHAVCKLLENESLLRKHQRGCIEFATGRSTEWEADVIVNSVSRALSGKEPGRTKAPASYLEDPVIAPDDGGASIQAFCAWQRRLATSSEKESNNAAIADRRSHQQRLLR